MSLCVNDTTKKEKGKHLTREDRYLIEKMLKSKYKTSEIAKILGRHRTTIQRELSRGLTCLASNGEIEYSAYIGQNQHEMNGTAKGPMLKIGNDHELAEFIEGQIKKENYSPEAVIGLIKTKKRKFKTVICWKTIYNYVDKGILDISNKDLPYRKDKKENKSISQNRWKRGKGKSIEERPEEANTRERMGHWEMDCVVSKIGDLTALLVLSERSSRKELIYKIKNKTTSEVIKVIDNLEVKYGNRFGKIFKTITVDNGSEFMGFKEIEQSKIEKGKDRVKVYFAHPYSSWERGTNENINRMIRRFIPKGTQLSKISNKEIKRIEKWINNYPRKIFNYRTANEIYKEKLAA